MSLFTHFLLEKDSWLASCITFIPTPAIPIPVTTINSAISHCGMETVKMSMKGTKNIENMMMALVYSFQFPVLLRSLSLKYVFTRLFKVLKNFALSILENCIVFIVVFMVGAKIWILFFLCMLNAVFCYELFANN